MNSSKANDVQIAGNHYKSSHYQHWDFVVDNGLGYFEGQISKYVTRWRKKNGLQDLQKAAHFAQKLFEVATTATPNAEHDIREPRRAPAGFFDYMIENDLTTLEGKVIYLCATFVTVSDLREIKRCVEQLIGEAPPAKQADQ